MTTPTVTTPTDPTHMAIPTDAFREIYNLVRISQMTGELGCQLLTVFRMASGVNIKPAAPAE